MVLVMDMALTIGMAVDIMAIDLFIQDIADMETIMVEVIVLIEDLEQLMVEDMTLIEEV